MRIKRIVFRSRYCYLKILAYDSCRQRPSLYSVLLVRVEQLNILCDTFNISYFSCRYRLFCIDINNDRKTARREIR